MTFDTQIRAVKGGGHTVGYKMKEAISSADLISYIKTAMPIPYRTVRG